MESPGKNSAGFYSQSDAGFASGPKDHLFKVLVVGEYAVGKTSLIRRYTEGNFSPNYKLTIGVDFALKVIEWDENTRVNLQLWDVAGHERFGCMTRAYYKFAIAAIVVFDLGRPSTFEQVLKWYIDINNCIMLANGNPIPVLLLANKSDMEEIVIDEKSLNDFCQEHGFIGWFPTSAKINFNVEKAMNFLISHILQVQGQAQTNLDDCVLLPGHRDLHILNSRNKTLVTPVPTEKKCLC